jgi:preprotein translocase subunit SecF
MDIPNVYKWNYKLLVVVPLFIIALSLLFIPHIKLGVDFKGGTLISMQATKNYDSEQLKNALVNDGLPVSNVRVFSNQLGTVVEVELEQDDNTTQIESSKSAFFSKVDDVSRIESGLVVEPGNATILAAYREARAGLDKDADSVFAIAGVYTKASAFNSTNELEKAVSEAYQAYNQAYTRRITESVRNEVDYTTISFQSVSASLSTRFIEKAVWVVVVSAILTSIVVFFIFRTVIPSIAVMVGAASDVIIALGAMGLLGIPMTLASFAALLMLIGFSLDTDVLLTMRVVKRREGHASDRAFDAMKTGMTMSSAAMIAFAVLFVLSSLTHIATYYEISAVALAGLIGDIFATWGLNAVIVLWYAERQEGKGEPEHKGGFSSIFSG